MSLFMWKKSYEIKVAEIDMQHRQLVGLINELSAAMMARQGHRAVHHVLGELINYTQGHFATEEALMQKMNYPGLDDHRQEHLSLAGKVLAYQEHYTRDKELGSSELLDFLCAWLKNHILVSDKAFGTYIRRVEMGLEKNYSSA